jgi:hypothetical protein
MRFNNLLDAFVAGVFLLLLSSIVLLSVREWLLLLARRKAAVLRETDPVWLPDYAIAEAKPLPLLGLAGLALALAKELSGEAHLERARQAASLCQCEHGEQAHLLGDRKSDQQLYLELTDQRFKGVRRCC